jgi:aminoglycoside phosphotransferase (APT) family kinase protein
VIAAPDGGVAGVLDWDRADEHAPPLEDVLHLLVYRKGPLGAYDPGSRLADLLRGQCPVADRRRLCAYAQRLQLDSEVLGALMLVYWVRYLETRASFLRGLRRGYARAYLPVRRVVEGRLGAGLDAIGRQLAAT